VTGVLDDRGIEAVKVRDFLFFTASRSTLGATKPPMQWIRRVLSPGAKLLGYEYDHSTLHRPEVMNA
jgi:hypothetical protein